MPSTRREGSFTGGYRDIIHWHSVLNNFILQICNLWNLFLFWPLEKKLSVHLSRAVIKWWGLGYYERGPWLLSKENRRKIEPKETPSCMIPRLLVLFTQQLEILVTTLPIHFPLLLGCMIMSLKQIKCKLTKDKIELNLCRFD